MKVGDLVFEVPFGQEWFRNNPWLAHGLGIVTEVIDFETVLVFWSTGEHRGRVDQMNTEYLQKVEGMKA